MAFQKSRDNFSKCGIPSANHMNNDVVEVSKRLAPPPPPCTLPGSLLHKKEPGCKARSDLAFKYNALSPAIDWEDSPGCPVL